MRGVWATPAAREEFSEEERAFCVADYEERGPQYFAVDSGFAKYGFAGGRVLVLAERRGLCTLMTEEEVEEERRNLRAGR